MSSKFSRLLHTFFTIFWDERSFKVFHAGLFEILHGFPLQVATFWSTFDQKFSDERSSCPHYPPCMAAFFSNRWKNDYSGLDLKSGLFDLNFSRHLPVNGSTPLPSDEFAPIFFPQICCWDPEPPDILHSSGGENLSVAKAMALTICFEYLSNFEVTGGIIYTRVPGNKTFKFGCPSNFWVLGQTSTHCSHRYFGSYRVVCRCSSFEVYYCNVNFYLVQWQLNEVVYQVFYTASAGHRDRASNTWVLM